MSVKFFNPTCVIYLDCAGDVARRRFLHRARGDDSEEIFDRRYDEFGANNPPILERYRDLVHTVKSIPPAFVTFELRLEQIDANTTINVAYERFLEKISGWMHYLRDR